MQLFQNKDNQLNPLEKVSFKLEKNINDNFNFKSALIIGFFQILSLIPGVSRSGIVITVCRFSKFKRVDAAKISFLLSIPALAGASVLSLINMPNKSLDFNLAICLSILFSFIFLNP